MARNFDGDNRLYRLSTPVTAPQFAVAAWFNPLETASKPIVSIDTLNGNARYTIFTSSGGDCGAVARNTSGSEGISFSSGNYTLNSWNHLAGVFISNVHRTCYLNGTAGSLDSTNITVSGVNHINIGAEYTSGSITLYFVGRIAEVSIWDFRLTDAEIAVLATGIRPTSVRPSRIVFYAPLLGGYTPEKDLVGGLTLTGG